MGPLDGDIIGPYAEMAITTRKSDVQASPDNEPGFRHVIIGLLLFFPALWVVSFIGLFVWAHIGLIIPYGIIGLCFWAYSCYRTRRGQMFVWNYRTTKAQRIVIRRRLSVLKKV